MHAVVYRLGEVWIVTILGLVLACETEPWMTMMLVSGVSLGVVAAWGLPRFMMRATIKWCAVPKWLIAMEVFNVIVAGWTMAGVFGLKYAGGVVDGIEKEAEARSLGDASGAWNIEAFREAFHAVERAGTEDMKEFPPPERGGAILPVTQLATRALLQRQYAERTRDRLLYEAADDWKLAVCRKILRHGEKVPLDFAKLEDMPVPGGVVSLDVAHDPLLRGAVVFSVRAVCSCLRGAVARALVAALPWLVVPAAGLLLSTCFGSWFVAYRSFRFSDYDWNRSAARR